MSEAYGIEGLNALVFASNELAIQIIKTLKSKQPLIAEGVSLAEALLGDETFKQQVGTVVSKFSELPNEVRDLSAVEVAQLATTQVTLIPQIMAALKA